MAEPDFSRTALVLVGHGSSRDDEAGAAVREHAAELRQRKIFAGVYGSFWKEEPQVQAVVAGLSNPGILVVPLFISEGYFSDQVVPAALGFPEGEPGQRVRVQNRGAQVIAYAGPVGTHERITQVILSRAEQVLRQHPFPRVPHAKDVAIFIAGHGTAQNENSRKAIESQVQRVRAAAGYAGVHAVFLEEKPFISECYGMTRASNLVVVPFFMGDGPHVVQDIPVMLGEPETRVRERLMNRQATWRNPTEKHGKLVWYAGSVGTDPQVAEIILARARECALGLAEM